jgi:VIT1/CCC1 family predicted Fe2+/Mn2+ transporter
VAVIVIGAANLAADGVSMGVGNLLSIRADERAREAAALPQLEAYPWKHGLATTLAFVVAGTIPLLPYVVPGIENRLVWSSVLTFAALFTLGASRAFVTVDRWWRSGLETLALGAVVAVTAYGAGTIGALFARHL